MDCMVPRYCLFALALVLQGQDTDLAGRLLQSGEKAYAAQRISEALETWQQLLQQAPAAPEAAEALLRLARHHVQVEAKPDLAMGFLDRIRTDHLKTPAAPWALLLRAQVLAARARRPSDLQEAIAECHRLIDLFPDHGAVPQAHLVLGGALTDQGSLGKAMVEYTTILQWDPTSLEAAEAMLRTAEILDQVGDSQGCLRMLQALCDRFPESPQGREACWKRDLRVKQRVLKPALVSRGPWPEGRTKWLKTPTMLARGPRGELLLYQDDLDQAFRLEGAQLVPVGPTLKGARALFVTPQGKVGLVSGKAGVVREDRSEALALSQTAPSGAFLDRWDHLWVSDAKAPAILRLGPEGSTRSVPSPSLVALAPIPGGGAVGASDANRALIFMDVAGQPRLTVPYGRDLPASFKQVLALASDEAGHVAALVDGDFEGVVIWGPQGQVLRSATYKQMGISGRFRALAFDRSGGLILADRSNDVLMRLE